MDDDNDDDDDNNSVVFVDVGAGDNYEVLWKLTMIYFVIHLY